MKHGETQCTARLERRRPESRWTCCNLAPQSRVHVDLKQGWSEHAHDIHVMFMSCSCDVHVMFMWAWLEMFSDEFASSRSNACSCLKAILQVLVVLSSLESSVDSGSLSYVSLNFYDAHEFSIDFDRSISVENVTMP